MSHQGLVLGVLCQGTPRTVHPNYHTIASRVTAHPFLLNPFVCNKAYRTVLQVSTHPQSLDCQFEVFLGAYGEGGCSYGTCSSLSLRPTWELSCTSLVVTPTPAYSPHSHPEIPLSCWFEVIAKGVGRGEGGATTRGVHLV